MNHSSKLSQTMYPPATVCYLGVLYTRSLRAGRPTTSSPLPISDRLSRSGWSLLPPRVVAQMQFIHSSRNTGEWEIFPVCCSQRFEKIWLYIGEMLLLPFSRTNLIQPAVYTISHFSSSPPERRFLKRGSFIPRSFGLHVHSFASRS